MRIATSPCGAQGLSFPSVCPTSQAPCLEKASGDPWSPGV